MTLQETEVNVDWLMPFQTEDVEKLVDRRSILIANEMGTGKTYEAIALDLLRRSVVTDRKLKTLVVAPLTILESTWADHYEELAPHLRTVVINPKARASFLSALKDDDVDVYILHWDVLRIIKDQLREVIWFHIIADEAHRAKNRKAQQTRSLKSLRTGFRTAMTGTPVMNKPQDLWSILNWLYRDQWRSYWKFYNRYVDFEVKYPHQYHEIKGPKNVRELRETIEPYFSRRTKQEVLPDLPEKYYTRLTVDLTPKQRIAYDQMKKEMIAWLDTQDGTKPLPAPVVIAQLIRLQQFSLAYADIVYSGIEGEGGSVQLTEPSSKLDALFQIIEDNPDEPLVIFSQFKQAIRLVESRLRSRDMAYVRITGDDSGPARRRAVDTFQEGGANVFVGTIGAGSEGITLTRSSTVIFLDRDWTPARNAQAEDRLHRIGQRDAVQVIDIMARNTVDQYRFARLEMKKEWIRQMIDDG
jgi:SNF2 family DNA or RNA helicase